MKILVIGDSCTDIFRYGKVERLAPEAPVPVIIPEKEESTPGMAGNVVRNLEILGADVTFITNITNIKKVRYVCSKYNHILLRVDENDKCENIRNEVIENIKWDKFNAKTKWFSSSYRPVLFQIRVIRFFTLKTNKNDCNQFGSDEDKKRSEQYLQGK